MYVELHARSAFTFLEGGSIPEELVDVCKKLEMPAMALLDRDGVYGAARFHLSAKKLKIKAHIGAEITTQGSWIMDCESKGRVGGRKELGVRSRESAQQISRASTVHFPLLVRERIGYQNLCRLVTLMKARGPKNCDPAI